MPQNFACLVINLDGSDDRLRVVSASLGRAGIAFDRLPAVDGRTRQPDAFPDYDGDRAMRHMGCGLVGGEVGCYLSHLAAARAFLDTGLPYGLVLEDDAASVPDLRRIVVRTIDFLDAADPAWRIVNLGNEKLKLSTPCLEIEAGGATYILERAFHFPWLASAILWSRRGAGEFVVDHDRIFAPVDVFFRHWITRVGGGYAFAPQLRPVPTNPFPSCIDGEVNFPRIRTKTHPNPVSIFRKLLEMYRRECRPSSRVFVWRKQFRLAMEHIIALHRKMTAPPLRRPRDDRFEVAD